VPSLAETLRADQIVARKASDKDRTLLLGTVLAALKNRELDSGEQLTDDQVVEVLRKQVKQRLDSVDQYTKANRLDLAGIEQAEIDLLKDYLPAEADPSEIRVAADAAVAGGAADLGRLMGVLMGQFKGKADGKVVNRIAREALGQG
jgi:uncharacterized protein YqeY